MFHVIVVVASDGAPKFSAHDSAAHGWLKMQAVDSSPEGKPSLNRNVNIKKNPQST